MRPYLEVKVVKVKKQENKHSVRLQGLENMMKIPVFMIYIPDIILELKAECEKKLSKPKGKGNWVNGEDLDKIKFPCFCRYIDKITKVKCYAEINQGYGGYKLSRLFQADGESIFYGDISLEGLIRDLDIHILKGKIILFEEE